MMEEQRRRRREKKYARRKQREQHGFAIVMVLVALTKRFDLRILGNSGSDFFIKCILALPLCFSFSLLSHIFAHLIIVNCAVFAVLCCLRHRRFRRFCLLRWQNYFANVVTLRQPIKRFHFSQIVFLISFSFWFVFFSFVDADTDV